MKINIVDLLTESVVYKAIEEQKGLLECKFVLISDASEINFLFGPLREFNYHAKLVEHFCTQYAIPSVWSHKPDLFEMYNTSFRVNGGGWLMFDFSKGKMTIHGHSTAYGRFNESKLKTVLESAKLTGKFEIEVK